MPSDLGNLMVMAENIQYYLDQNKINSVKMAEDLNINYTTVRNWIQGRSYPRIDKIEMMANYFGVEKSDLIERHTKKENLTKFSDDLENAIEHAENYSGKPLSSTDKQILRGVIEAYLQNRDGNEE
ncbi:helix-turn-helix transcriptional regulator [Lactococcus lactis]|uniref:Helix-turn-helix transcriptional regulator n=1 Tax=Lactococcus lactis TaxID=1358 RepID=A0AAW8UFT1_9LACT|nr:helix-turn-helix transcriptional regulator [Lactococcus lactis]MDT2882017.1 helix-turn-helix transcriptional regulator [Lactococcus lactis]MDT2946825.1 helix-turn-helix transcriptional regulator [Lactococcus lactis]MDT2947644.1 helix-turn-helix transcriptional regulator [Lactococcus lactis]